MAPAEANGWKFHVLGAKVELGNKHPLTIRPPGNDHTRIVTPGIALLDGVGAWLTAPGDIRKAVEKVPTAIGDQGNRFYQLLAETIEWFKGLVMSYGLTILLGFAATMFLSAITAAFIIGRLVRSELAINR